MRTSWFSARFVFVLAVTALLGGSVSPVVLAQELPGPSVADLERRVQELEEIIRRGPDLAPTSAMDAGIGTTQAVTPLRLGDGPGTTLASQGSPADGAATSVLPASVAGSRLPMSSVRR